MSAAAGLLEAPATQRPAPSTQHLGIGDRRSARQPSRVPPKQRPRTGRRPAEKEALDVGRWTLGVRAHVRVAPGTHRAGRGGAGRSLLPLPSPSLFPSLPPHAAAAAGGGAEIFGGAGDRGSGAGASYGRALDVGRWALDVGQRGAGRWAGGRWVLGGQTRPPPRRAGVPWCGAARRVCAWEAAAAPQGVKAHAPKGAEPESGLLA